MNYKIFFRDLADSLNPGKYQILIDDKFTQILKFFFCTLLLFLIISSILFVPKLVILPFQVEKEFAKFTEFSIDAKVKTSAPVNLGFITIDTNAKDIPDKKGLFVTNETLRINLLPFGIGDNQAQLEDLKDLSQNKKTVKVNLILGTVLLLPYIFILIYVYSAIKYLLLAAIVAAFAVIATRTLKGVVKARIMLKSALYATPILMLELILQVFTSNWYINTLLPFMMFVIFVAIVNIMLGKEHVLRSTYKRKGHMESKGPHTDNDDDEEDIDPDFFANTKFGGKVEVPKDSVDMSALQRDLEKHRIR